MVHKCNWMQSNDWDVPLEISISSSLFSRSISSLSSSSSSSLLVINGVPGAMLNKARQYQWMGASGTTQVCNDTNVSAAPWASWLVLEVLVSTCATFACFPVGRGLGRGWLVATYAGLRQWFSLALPDKEWCAFFWTVSFTIASKLGWENDYRAIKRVWA